MKILIFFFDFFFGGGDYVSNYRDVNFYVTTPLTSNLGLGVGPNFCGQVCIKLEQCVYNWNQQNKSTCMNSQRTNKIE